MMNSYDPDIEDLLGPSEPAPTPKAAIVDRLIQETEARRRTQVSLHLTDMHAGVTVSWLAEVFGMDPKDVKRRLADCPPIANRKNGYIYSIPMAARYLIKPVFDIKKFLATMKPSELPPQLQGEFWTARLRQQKWEENAGQLWRTEKILEVLGEMFKTIKFTMQLWVDNLERSSTVSPEQRRLLVGMVDALQDEVYQSLVDFAKESKTRASIADLTAGDDDVSSLI